MEKLEHFAGKKKKVLEQLQVEADAADVFFFVFFVQFVKRLKSKSTSTIDNVKSLEREQLFAAGFNNPAGAGGVQSPTFQSNKNFFILCTVLN